LKISLGLSRTVTKDLVKAFTNSTSHVLKDIQLEHGLDTGNYKNGGAWDVRFKRIREVALSNDLVVLEISRGALWTFNCILNLETKSMLVFSKEKNLDIVIKKLGTNSIHYFHAFVALNGDPLELDNQQLGLFSPLPDNYEERRLDEVRKILGERYPDVNQVVFVVAKEEDKQITSVEARLFNRYFSLLDIQDWSDYISEEFNDIFVSNEQDIDQEDEIKPIAKIKPSVKNKKHSFNEKLTKKKDDEKKEEDTK
jgi:hypothetical protein